MNELVRVIEHNGNKAVSARELHEFLEVQSPFRKWIDRMFEYGFDENQDFVRADKNVRGNELKEYILTLDCAKEISMLQRNEKGKQARRYFIEVEKKAKELIDNLTPAELLLHNAKLLVEQERRYKEHDNRISLLEAKTTTRPDYFTIAGYATWIGKSVNLAAAGKLGRAASRLCKSRGLMTEIVSDIRFGKVNSYPKKVLEEVFETVEIN